MLDLQYRELYYSTFTILHWQKLFLKEEIVNEVYESFKFLSYNRKWLLHAYVIMPNHIHLIYQVTENTENERIKHSFKGFLSKKIISILSKDELISFPSNKQKQIFQIWKSPSLSVEIYSQKFLEQKFNYLHNNPVKANLVKNPEDYKHCSYQYYVEDAEVPDWLVLL